MIFIKAIRKTKEAQDKTSYPYSIPAIKKLDFIDFTKSVTFFIGENGIGKSTLLESIAINAGFNPEGGSRNFNFRTFDSHSELHHDIKLVRGSHRNKDGYFLRAESFYNVASEVERLLTNTEIEEFYGRSLHQCSHGESFLALIQNRFFGEGLYILDEPESALSMMSQMKIMVAIKKLVEKRSQFIISTHSPILLAYPEATIYQISSKGFQRMNYEETEQYRLYKYFLNNYQKMIRDLGLI